MSRFDRPLSPRLVSGAVGLLLIVQPVAAQSGIDFLTNEVCSGSNRMATLIAAALAMTVIYFVVHSVHRWVTGLKMVGASDPNVQTEGKKRLKGGFHAFGAAILILGVERILAFIGLSIPQCINIGLSM